MKQRQLARGLLSVLALTSAQAAAPKTLTPPLQAALLRPTFGGVLLEGRLSPRGGATLNGVWADTGRANLMRCAPSCAIVSSIPVNTPLTVSQTSMYRVVLGGTFKPRQNVRLLLRFSKGDPLTVSVPVAGK